MVTWPCMAGINAALLAESGFFGPRAIFEGDKGFFRMAGSDRYEPSALTQRLGKDFEIEHVYFKPYPCCRWSHAAVDGVTEILGRREWGEAEVLRIEIGVAREVLEDLGDHAPRTMVDAEFSLPYAAALALLRVPPGRDGTPRLCAIRRRLQPCCGRSACTWTRSWSGGSPSRESWAPPSGSTVSTARWRAYGSKPPGEAKSGP
jgi:2-methylcitrate dehydratase PrpD